MIENSIEIRAAVPEDSPQIARIWLDGLQGALGVSGPSQEEASASFEFRILHPEGKSGIWVAVVDDEIVGWQGLQDFGVTRISQIAQSSTYIAEQWHAKGVGRKLLHYAQERARERRIALVVGWIKSDNKSSLALVRSLDWQFVGTLPRNNECEPELGYWRMQCQEMQTNWIQDELLGCHTK